MSYDRYDHSLALDAASDGGRHFVEHAPGVADRLFHSDEPVIAAALSKILDEVADDVRVAILKVGGDDYEAQHVSDAYRASITVAIAERKRGAAH